MKRRSDFVTNSSSSSFLCDICGYETSGYDMSYRDAGMYQCVNGHEFCTHHAIELSKEEMLKLILENSWNKRYDRSIKESVTIPESELVEMDEDTLMSFVVDSYSEVPEEICPICSMKKYKDTDILKYLLREKKTNMDAVFAEIQERFSTYSDFEKYLKG